MMKILLLTLSLLQMAVGPELPDKETAHRPIAEVFAEKPIFATGNYRPPTLDISTAAKAPKGYEIFHISSYTRHGARNFSRNEVYESVLQLLHSAENDGKLTQKGAAFLHIYKEIYEKSIGGNSDLTAIGAAQQKALAEKIYKEYRPVFRKRKTVDARSTTAPRCILSMAAFCGSLHDRQQNLGISMQASPRHMAALNPNSSYNPELQDDLRENVMESPEAPYWDDYKALWRKLTEPEIFFSRLISDRKWFLEHCEDEYEMLKRFYYMIGIEQCCTGRNSLMEFATAEELEAMFECENFRFFCVSGRNPYYRGRNWALSRSLLQDILEYAGRDIRSDSDVAARLRFGHDFRLASLLSLLRADGFDRDADTPEEAVDVFRFYESPMAANLLFLFYRNREGKVLVRLQLDGRNLKLPIGGTSVDGVEFYAWSEFRAYCEARIEEAGEILSLWPYRPMMKGNGAVKTGTDREQNGI